MPDTPPRTYSRSKKRQERDAAAGGTVIDESPPVETPPEPERDRPPFIPRADKRTKDDPEPPGKPHTVIERKLTNFIVSLALPFAAAGDEHCAKILANRGPVVAEAWANLANESPAVKRVLESMLKGGAWAGAISSTLAVAVPIAAHHGAPLPDFISPIIMGTGTDEEKGKSDSEPFVAERRPPPQPPPSPTSRNGGGAPGPAAVSTLRTDSGLADPTNYPQPGNAQQFRKN